MKFLLVCVCIIQSAALGWLGADWYTTKIELLQLREAMPLQRPLLLVSDNPASKGDQQLANAQRQVREQAREIGELKKQLRVANAAAYRNQQLAEYMAALAETQEERANTERQFRSNAERVAQNVTRAWKSCQEQLNGRI